MGSRLLSFGSAVSTQAKLKREKGAYRRLASDRVFAVDGDFALTVCSLQVHSVPHVQLELLFTPVVMKIKKSDCSESRDWFMTGL